MHVEGKDLPVGKYLFHRYLTYNGEKKKVNTYKIEKTTDGYKFYESPTVIDDEIRRMELKKNYMALIWSKHSRLGLLYSIETPSDEDEKAKSEEK